MKKLILSILGLLISFNAHATTCTVPYPNELTGAFIYAAHWNANFVAIQTCLNNQTLDGTTNISIGGIQTANLANLAVTDAKIFGITTAGKVNGSAITQINNLPSGAGALPAKNGGTGADLSAATQGDVPYFSTTGVQSYTPSGTAGQVLESQGSSSQPVFGFPSGMLGVWASKTPGTIYQASTDGFVTSGCVGSGSGGSQLLIYTDSSSGPSTIRCQSTQSGTAGAGWVSCFTPVIKNNYYQVVYSGNACNSGTFEYFLPIGS